WTKIQAKVTALSPKNDPKADISFLSSGAALRLITKPKEGKGKGKGVPRIPKELHQYEDGIKKLNAQFGIKAPPAAVLALLAKLGIGEAEIKKGLEQVT